jgi:hypothetical protein
VGEVHDGIAQMFKVIEYARMLVGTKAISTLSTGYLNALQYATERVQGPDLKAAMDKTAPRVPIIRHPDVRRMLMTQKAHVEGLRALAAYTGFVQDQIKLAHSNVSQDVKDWERLNDLLLPMVKGYGSEKSYELLAMSLQVFGGAGYTRDYPIEQYIRDAKIDTLYEGTTGIQGMDLFFRKIGKDQGATLTRLLTDVQEFAKGEAGNGHLADQRQRLQTALEDVQGMLGSMVQFLGEDLYKIGLNTTPLLFSLSELVIGWLLLRGADVAITARAAGDLKDGDDDFYDGKIIAAKWFADNVLPWLPPRPMSWGWPPRRSDNPPTTGLRRFTAEHLPCARCQPTDATPSSPTPPRWSMSWRWKLQTRWTGKHWTCTPAPYAGVWMRPTPVHATSICRSRWNA